ncbi:MAG: MerR family transcriptional regulator [Chloroflexi bacterium]|nr:MerR family transcriptional regulator [Chloroflexota bacterium]MCI0576162.1 MerR family transcriptional regulator [Chloroflexota bacterium]MCI0645431.1 MerR family transcriptional regulator [Chloroflexota bacterium]MCI0731297.1 MerR family transcriptional regulator [Chloroflexota bacterium]
MFTVGEFSRLAQVSKRLLRYYDEIGLLKPIHTEPLTGYRYYSAEQMSHLNWILALKELGLSLDQIQRMLSDNVSTDEIQGMLLLKKAEIEQQLQGELKRIRNIETRLQSIRNAEAGKPLDVIIKQIPAQPVLSVRLVVESFDVGMAILRQIRTALPEKSPYGLCFLICHDDDIVERDMDLEMGRLIEAKTHPPVPLHGDLQLRFRELPAVATMATTVVKGALETIHTGYAEIGRWAEVNGYRFAGTPREITLQAPQASDGRDLITEIQFPVEPVRLPLAAVLHWGGPQFPLLAAAAVLHIIGANGVTVAGNIPLNNKLAKIEVSQLPEAEADQIRKEFQGPGTPWMRLHAVRTLAAIAATALVFIVCLSKGLSK